MRRLLLLLFVFSLTSASHASWVPPARTVEQIEGVVRGSHGAAAPGNLADYAAAPSPMPTHTESYADAARRILAGKPATLRTPEATAVALDQLATRELTSRDLEARIGAHYARYHAHRMIAAIHYNLFLRAQKLAELVAATYREKAAVTAFREFVAAAEAARHSSAPAFRADLRKLEHSLQDLEAQCCPPDEATLREPIWQPPLPLPPAPRKS